jgi:hypothetical protein
MSGEGIGSQRLHGFNDTRSKRVKVDVAHRGLKFIKISPYCILCFEIQFFKYYLENPFSA